MRACLPRAGGRGAARLRGKQGQDAAAGADVADNLALEVGAVLQDGRVVRPGPAAARRGARRPGRASAHRQARARAGERGGAHRT